MAWLGGWDLRRRAVQHRAGLHHRDCRCHPVGWVFLPVQGCCRGVQLRGGRQGSRAAREHRAAVHRRDAEELRGAVRLLGQDGVHPDAQETPDVQEHLGVSAEGVPPIPVWLAAAEAAPFC